MNTQHDPRRAIDALKHATIAADKHFAASQGDCGARLTKRGAPLASPSKQYGGSHPRLPPSSSRPYLSRGYDISIVETSVEAGGPPVTMDFGSSHAGYLSTL